MSVVSLLFVYLFVLASMGFASFIMIVIGLKDSKQAWVIVVAARDGTETALWSSGLAP